MNSLKLVIITGLSGSGKSTAIDALEDAGFFCVDNLPVALLPKFLELPLDSGSELTGLAFVMDIRERSFPALYRDIFDDLRTKGFPFEMLFFEAEDSVLVQRFSQTRRHHPLSKDRGIIAGIRAEKEQFQGIRRYADQIIDTTHYTTHDLKAVMTDFARETRKRIPMRIRIMSFGFKYGLPLEADLVADVRFLANPYFVPELKPLDGKTEAVRDYVLKRTESGEFLKRFVHLLEYTLPLYEKEGKAYLTVAVGCTGGKHRSVSVAYAIYDKINTPGRWVTMIHRDIGKE